MFFTHKSYFLSAFFFFTAFPLRIFYAVVTQWKTNGNEGDSFLVYKKAEQNKNGWLGCLKRSGALLVNQSVFKLSCWHAVYDISFGLVLIENEIKSVLFYIN